MAITTNGITGVGPDTAQTLTNKTLESPVINNATFTGQQAGLQIAFNDSIVFEGTTADAYETTLSAGDPTADRTITLPNATTTLVGRDTTDTLTNKTLTSPVISTISNTGTLTLPTSTGTLALTSDITVTASSTTTLSNKTISLSSNTVSGTTSEFNTALSDGDFATLAGNETLTNKILTTPVVTQGQATPSFSANAYTLIAGDAGKLLLASNSTTAGTVYIPTDATTNFATGTQITILQTGSGQLTIAATTPATTTVYSTGATAASPKCRVQYSAITLWKSAANTWYAFGDVS